jgi:hypothetical protein
MGNKLQHTQCHRVKILAQNMYIERVLCTEWNGVEGRIKKMACTEIKWNIQDQKGNVRENRCIWK